MNDTPFNVVKGTEASIKACRPLQGYLWFALDTRKIYYSDGTDFISMGGNSSVFYGTLTWDEKPDSDQVEFDFTPADIEGDATPNENDLILNVDGCFYRVVAIENGIIKTLKLTIAGSGSGGSGGGGDTPISTSVITISVPAFSKYFLETETEPTFSFDVHSSLERNNKIIRITYTIGTRTYVDEQVHDFGTITLNLKDYFGSISENGTSLSIKVEDMRDGQKTVSNISLRKVKLLLTADSANKDDILQAEDKKLQYSVIPVGSSSITGVKVYYKVYTEGSNAPIWEDDTSVNNLNGFTVSKNLDFSEIDTSNNGLGAYTLEVYCAGMAGSQEVISNVLKHSVISYGENPILIAYLPTNQLTQYDSVNISYEIAKSIIDNQKARITFEIDGDITYQEVEFNKIYNFNVYFETTGYHSIFVRDEYNNTQSFTDIYVSQYDGSIQVINNDDALLMLNLTARGRNNNEIAEDRIVWADKKRTGVAALSDFVWGNVNGWLTDDENVNMLRLSSGANMIVNGYEPFNLNANGKEGMETGKSIELDFRISNVTDYSLPLITCLSYDNNNNILCGFHITGEAATFNTRNIKATGGTITEGEEEDQAYNTQIQGLTAKFAEGERIHLTWVVQRKDETYPMIKTYINGIVSGITEYTGNSDSILQNNTTGAEPALIKINSNVGTVDLYNIRVFNKVLSDRQVLENYIATLPTTEEKASCYANNIGLLDSTGEISVNNIESGNYNIQLPYIKFTGGGQCRKDDAGYWLTNADGTNHLPRSKKDYRLVNHFDFVYPSDSSRNVDLVSEVADNGLVNGVVMYGQGTSSMEYPIKNLRIKFKMKKNGKKVKFQVNKEAGRADYPVDILTLKADYMESSSSHNTGTANFVFDSLEALGFHTPGQTYWNAYDPDYKTLTAIRGYPIICFFRPDENSDFEFIGRYNLNMDKSSEEAFGFLPVPAEEEEIEADGSNIEFGWIENHGISSGTNLDPVEHPYVNAIHCYEFLNNASNLDNFIVGNTGLSFEELFYQPVLNEKQKFVPNWTTSFESRYPEESEDVEAFFQMCNWVNSTNPDEATGEALDSSVTYKGTTYTTDSREYRLAKFTNEFEDHFNKNFVIFYYVLSHVLLMIDSRAKNMMIATWDNQHWYPIFYDMDTMLGLNNYGYNKFDYNVEDKDENVFNGQASVLWNNLKVCFESDIREMYDNMQKDGGLTYGNLLRNYNTIQADKWNEIMYNYDAIYKYITPYAEGYYDGKNLDENGNPVIIPAGTKNYLYAAQGSRSMHRRYWLKNRIAYFDGKYLSENYRSDKYTMRIYTPQAGQDNYFRVYDVNASNFNQKTYYTREETAPGTYVFTEATSFVSGTEYYEKADNRLANSLNVVPPNNDYLLTPLHNQYLAVAFGGSNGQTSGPWYAVANEPYLVAAPTGAQYNDTETYVYGASQIKDLGDLSSQYLGLFLFPGETKLERLILGNKNNSYYNPNFSQLAIAQAAPQLKYLDISNTQLKGALDLSYCQNLEEVYACGSSITSMPLPSYGVLKELRLPSTITSLTLSYQTQLDINHFTIGTYNSNGAGSYTMSNTPTLQLISIEGMPQFDSYQLFSTHANSLMYYCLRDINWTVRTGDLRSVYDENNNYLGIGISPIETIIANGATPYKDGSVTSPARALTGTINFASGVTAANMLAVYERYSNIYPDLVFNFDQNNIKHINLYDGNGNIYWSKPIAVNTEMDENFYDSSSYGPFKIPQKMSTQQYKYVFENQWYIDNDNTQIINGEKPIISGPITDDINLYSVFSSSIQTYNITYHINDEIVVNEVEFGTNWIDSIPKFIPYSSQNTTLTETNRSVYPFLGYSESNATAYDNLFDFNTSNKVNTNKDFYAVFGTEKVDVSNSLNVFYPAWNIINRSSYTYDDTRTDTNISVDVGDPSFNLRGGYAAQFKADWTYYNFVTIPAKTQNGDNIYFLEGNESLPKTVINRVYCEEGSQLRVIRSSCFTNHSSLTYFDFPSSLRRVGAYAFTSTNLQNSIIGGENTTVIEANAFNQALHGNFIKIPSSVNVLENFACSYSGGLNSGWTLQIGDSEHYSNLNINLHTPVATANSRVIFGQNSGHLPGNINFYSKNYSSWDETVGNFTVIQHFFGENTPVITEGMNILKEGQG